MIEQDCKITEEETQNSCAHLSTMPIVFGYEKGTTKKKCLGTDTQAENFNLARRWTVALGGFLCYQILVTKQKGKLIQRLYVGIDTDLLPFRLAPSASGSLSAEEVMLNFIVKYSCSLRWL